MTAMAGPSIVRIRRNKDPRIAAYCFDRFKRWQAVRALLQAAAFVAAVPKVMRRTSEASSTLRAGQVLEIQFPSFTTRIALHSDRQLTVEIVAGDNFGFSDTVEYEAVTLREGLVLLSWQEHIGSTIVHVLDHAAGEAFTVVTPAKGTFMRLRGRITVRSAA
jgi:hypothetical protein